MKYTRMLCDHTMRGSGYQETLIKEQLVSNGCLNGGVSGKAYA